MKVGKPHPRSPSKSDPEQLFVAPNYKHNILLSNLNLSIMSLIKI